MKCLTRLLRRKKAITGWLWYILALVSIMPFVALPLSGLSMELSDGYVPSSMPAMVVGQTWAETAGSRGKPSDAGLVSGGPSLR